MMLTQGYRSNYLAVDGDDQMAHFGEEFYDLDEILGIKVDETLESFCQDFFGGEEDVKEDPLMDFPLKSSLNNETTLKDGLCYDVMWNSDGLNSPETNPISILYDPPLDRLWTVCVNPDEMQIKSEYLPEPYNPALDHNYIKVTPDPLDMPIKMEIKQELDRSDYSDYVTDSDPGSSPGPSGYVSYNSSMQTSYANSAYASDEDMLDENMVDVWNHTIITYSSPAPSLLNQSRYCARKGKQVSIKQAANAALKRAPQTNSNYDMRKRRKMASVETTPSGSDYEEPSAKQPRMSKSQVAAKPRGAPRGRKAQQGKRGPARKNASAKPTKSEVQRTNHNLNEKMRRNHMSSMMDTVRNLVPTEYYRDRTEKARAKASKQKVLVAAKAYVLHLRAMEEKPDVYQMQDYENADKRKHALKTKLKKFKKQWFDKFQRTNGYLHQTTAGNVL